MFKAIKEFFTGKKPEAAPEAPYKVETAPVVDPASWSATPAAEAVVVVPEAVAPIAVVEQAPVVEAKPAKTKKAPAKPKAEKKPAVKKPRAPRKPKAQ
jgi:hypothetical protein